MPLEDLNNTVNGNNAEELGQRMHAPEEFDPFEKKNAQASPFQGEQKWGKAEKGMTAKQKKILWSILGVIIFFLVSVGSYAGYQWYVKNAFHQDRVVISFEGPSSADSTQTAQYSIHYTNNNSVTLKNAQIIVDYSNNFQPSGDNVNLKKLSATSSTFFIGSIKPHGDATVTLKGTFYAPKDFPVYLHATLQYVPSNSSAQLETKNQFAVNITNSPVSLDLISPETVADGDRVEYVIDYKNLGTEALSDTQVRVEYPSGFEFADSSPAPSESQIAWYLGLLDSNQGGEIRIHGRMHGSNGDNKAIKVSLGHMGSDNQFALYNQRQKSSKLIASPLTISQSLDGSTAGVVQPGDTLRYVLAYRNTSNIGLRNVIITENINSGVLDFSQLTLTNGAFDNAANVITWKASDIPQLANIPPQGAGEIRFSVPVKNVIPVSDADSKNFTVDSVAKIDSPDVPTPIGSNKVVSSNTLSLKLGSKVIFETTGYYYDGQIANAGALPMVVGKETTFTLHWGITNVSNDLSGVKVSAPLPTGIRWVGGSVPAGEQITYDQRTNQVTWNVGKVVAGAGITSPKREIAFQVGITPQPSQVGGSPVLLNASTLSAHDDFTGQDISAGNLQVDTQLRWDTKLDTAFYQVHAAQ